MIAVQKVALGFGFGIALAALGPSHALAQGGHGGQGAHAAHGAHVAPAAHDSGQEGRTTARFSVPGMYCGGCVVGVRAALRRVEGVDSVAVSLEGRTASVRYDPRKVATDSLIAAIRRAGFEATVIANR